MLCVTEIKVVEADRPTLELVVRSNFDRIRDPAWPRDLTPEVATEMVRGRMFHVCGRSITLGWSAQVQEALGIPLEVIEKLQEEVTNLSALNRDLHLSLIAVRNLSVWGRIKALFFGVPVDG